MKVEVKEMGLKKPNKWDEVRVMRHVSENGDKEIIVLTNGKHSGDKNGSFEGTILYNNIAGYVGSVGELGVNWYKENFKEVSYLELVFSS